MDFGTGFPHADFTRLRQEQPVLFDTQSDAWAVIRHAECVAVADDVSTFGPVPSAGGGDEYRHEQVRQLLAPALSPSAMRGLESDLHWYAETIVRSAIDKSPCDFVADAARPFALSTVARILGVPLRDHERWLAWHQSSDAAVRAELHAYASQLIDAKLRHREGDLISRLVGKLPPDEVLGFFDVLDMAGAVTTCNAMALGMLALIEHDEQWAVLRHDRTRMRRGVEELLRWGSPTFFDRRVARRDVELGGQRITCGQQVVVWWASANRDEAVFADPFCLDVHRDPNPHLAFGHGAHGCLGGTLARLVMRLLLDEIVDRCERVELVGPPVWTPGDRTTALTRLPVVLHAL